MASTEVLSKREIRERMRTLFDAQAHLNPRMPVTNPHNAELRFSDMARFIGLKNQSGWLGSLRHENTGRDIEPNLQRKLSDFFQRWERGDLVKARIGNKWEIVARNSPLAQVAPAARSQTQARPPHEFKIDITATGPRLRRP